MGRGARVGAVLVAACLVATVACSPVRSDDATPDPTPTPTEPPVHTAELRLPDDEATVLEAADPAERAAAASRTFFASAPVAVVAPADDVATQVRAAAVAVALGAPMLLADAPAAAQVPGPGSAAPTGDGGNPETSSPETGTEETSTPDTSTGETGAPETGTEEAGDEGAGADGADPDGAGADGANTDATPPGPEPAAVELDRLGVLAVVTLGDVAVEIGPDVDVVPAPSDDGALATMLRRDLGTAAAPIEGGEIDTVAALDRAAPTLPGATVAATAGPTDPGPASATPTDAERTALDEPTGSDTPGPSASAGTGAPEGSSAGLPLLDLPEPLTGGLLMTTGAVSDLPAVATARAAGVEVLTVPSGDPRTSSATVQAVAAAAPEHVVGLGPELGDAERLAWTTATAATGVELPGGGQTIFPGRRFVAMYGTPSFAGLGILGEQDLPASVARAQALAAEYQPLTDDVVVPAFEIIVTVASAGAGDDGNYSNELPVDSFVPWVEAARDAGIYVLLDLQPGRTDFLTQAKLYEPLLRYPNVGLALDPEWRLKPDQVHLRQIGSVGIDEVNVVQEYLANLTRTNHLPQKLFVLHQFSLRMITDRERLDTSHPELAVMIHADGQGSQPAKAGTWTALHRGAPEGIAWGWKNFIDEDSPMLTPEQTYQVKPAPQLVSYQ